MVTFTKTRDVLAERLALAFSEEEFSTLCPGIKAPKVFTGFPKNEPPFYVAVDEIVDTAESSGSASMGHAQIDFTIRVWCFARHVDQKVVADTLLAYVGTVFEAVLADQRLCMSVDNSFPSVETAGTSADESKRYVAAASVAVACSVFSQCPAEIMSVVRKQQEGGN